MEINPVNQHLCDFIDGCMEYAEFEFTDTALKSKHLKNGLVREEIVTITLGYSCEKHVEEVREKLKKNAK
jgi:hypothetical protein|tara:strand:- start:139 stop:348 length:210 start_codon:yes stop_codon:yes gene_type:complete